MSVMSRLTSWTIKNIKFITILFSSFFTEVINKTLNFYRSLKETYSKTTEDGISFSSFNISELKLTVCNDHYVYRLRINMINAKV